MPSTRRKSRYPAKHASAPPATSSTSAGSSYECGITRSDLPPPFHRLVHRHLVGIFEVAADRHAHRDARHLHAERLQQPREINRGGFALDVRVGGENHFGDAVGDAADEPLDLE